jgi:hypothetical protein
MANWFVRSFAFDTYASGLRRAARQRMKRTGASRTTRIPIPTGRVGGKNFVALVEEAVVVGFGKRAFVPSEAERGLLEVLLAFRADELSCGSF